MWKSCASYSSVLPATPLGSARVSRVGFGVSPKQSFLRWKRTVIDRVRKVRDRETRSPTRETRALPGILIALARSDLGKFFSAQTQPVVPGLPHAVARGQIALVEFVAFDNL